MVEEMREVRARVTAARRELNESLIAARTAARKARDQGYSVAQISRSLGVSRQTVYNFFDEEV